MRLQCYRSDTDFHSNMFKKLAEKLAKESYGGNKYLQNDNGVTPYGILCEYLLWILILILLIAQLLFAIIVVLGEIKC